MQDMETPSTRQNFRQNTQRLGPRPLPLHLMMALSASLSLPAAWPKLKNDWPGLNLDQQVRLTRLREQAKNPNPDLDAAIAHESVARARAFVRGVKSYRHHSAKRSAPEAPVVWRAGTTALRDYNPDASGAPIVL